MSVVIVIGAMVGTEQNTKSSCLILELTKLSAGFATYLNALPGES